MNKKPKHIRLFVQIFFLILIALISVNHTLAENGGGITWFSSSSLHAICPFGGVVNIYTFFADGTFLKRIHESSFVVMIIMFILALGFGGLFCGWICPFGTVQELLGKVGRKIFKKKYNRFIPYKYDKYLRYFRYVVLFWVVYMTAKSGQLIFQNVDPYNALFHLWTSEVAFGGLIVLIIVIVVSIFIERPWCKYVCPYGALIGLFNIIRIFKIKRNSKSCVSCRACDKACPMNIEVSKSKVITNHQCISCMKCTSENSCPIEDTVILSAKGGE